MADSFNALFGLGSHSPDADLEGWWPLQDNAASTTVVDQSSNGRDATLQGGDNTADISTTGPNSWLKAALDLDGSADYISIADADWQTILDTGDEGTIGCWWSSDVSGNQYLIGKDEEYGLRLIPDSSQNYVRLDLFGANTGVATNLSLSSWRATTVRWDAGTGGEIRVDTSSYKTSTETNTSANQARSLAFGARDDAVGVDSFFNGPLAGVHFFSRQLTADEVDEIHDGPELINSIAPAMTGPEVIGGTLTCTTGTWVLDAPFSGGSNGTATYAYQWTRSNDAGGTGEADISGATSNTYTPVAADKGKHVRCRVRASNDGGFDSAADTNSNMSGAIVAGDIARPKVGASLANRTPLLGGLAA